MAQRTTATTTTIHKGIRKRGDSYLVSITVAGKRRTATCSSEEEALAKRAELREVLEGRIPERAAPQPTKIWTLAQALEEAQMTPPHSGRRGGWKGQSNIRKTVQNAEYSLIYFGEDRRLDDIGHEDLEQFCRHLEGHHGNAGGTVNRKLAALSKMMRLAIERGYLDRMPLFPRRQESEGRVKYLSHAQEAELLGYFEHAGRDYMVDLVAVLIDTGLRVSDCLALTAEEISLDTGEIVCWVSKSKRNHAIPMADRARTILARRMKASGRGKLFPYKYDHVKDMWNHARDHLGHADHKWYVIHICRHTCASRLVQGGVPINVVKEWMAHSDISVTQRYAHLAPRQLHQAVGVLNNNPAASPYEGVVSEERHLKAVG